MVEEPQTVVSNVPHSPAHAAPEHVADEENVQAADEAVAPEDLGPSVDALQDRLGDLQSAMDQLESGDLDGAESTIASLEEALAKSRQEHGVT